MSFTARLRAAWRDQDSLLCVGLDPDPTRIPASCGVGPDAIYEFCRRIVDATAMLACAFKPQIAYFAATRAESALEAIIAYIHEHYPQLPVILDAKRGDIGSTAAQYAEEAFGRYQADALTVNPYLGLDSIQPYLEWEGKGVILLCRTSNLGGADLQNLPIAREMKTLPADFSNDHQPMLYEVLAHMVAETWNVGGECALVVGATFPEELRRVRAIVGDMPLLVPGIGAQGGDLQETLAAGLCSDGAGLIINASRSILYASSGDDFVDAAHQSALAMQQMINVVRQAHAHG